MLIKKAVSLAASCKDIRNLTNNGSNAMRCAFCGFETSAFGRMSVHLNLPIGIVRDAWFNGIGLKQRPIFDIDLFRKKYPNASL